MHLGHTLAVDGIDLGNIRGLPAGFFYARNGIGRSLHAQSSVLIDSLNLPLVVGGLSVEGGLGGKTCHLAVLRHHIADGVGYGFP